MAEICLRDKFAYSILPVPDFSIVSEVPSRGGVYVWGELVWIEYEKSRALRSDLLALHPHGYYCEPSRQPGYACVANSWLDNS